LHRRNLTQWPNTMEKILGAVEIQKGKHDRLVENSLPLEAEVGLGSFVHLHMMVRLTCVHRIPMGTLLEEGPSLAFAEFPS